METGKSFPDNRSDEAARMRQELRERHKKLRDALREDEIAEKSAAVCARLLAADWYEKSRVIYGYYPLGCEADCRGFLRQALLDGKQVALPVTDRHRLGADEASCRMEFFGITSLSQVAEGAFHVMEPTEECPLLTVPDAVVLVPGVVFDRAGNRCGYGRGYYDRYFARFPGLYRVAAAYEQQIEERLITLPTDVKMYRIYTEEREYRSDTQSCDGRQNRRLWERQEGIWN